MKKLNGILLLIMLMLATTTEAAIIQQVEVEVVDKGRTSNVLLKRMSSSMQIVAQELLLEKDDAVIASEVGDYERLLSEVGDRALTGYQVEQVDINLSSKTKISIRVAPWNEITENVFVDLQFSGVDVTTAALLQDKFKGLQTEVINILQGSSVDASDWAGGILRRLVREQTEKSLPDFKAAVDLIREEERTVVQIVIYPVGKLVQTIDYSMVSQSIPNLLLLNLKQAYEKKAEALRGLPITYIERNLAELTEQMQEELLQEELVQRHHLKPSITLVPGSTLGVDIKVESNEYKIWFEGYGDIGRDDDNISGRAHFGKYISKRDEIFGEIGVTLNDVDWDFSAGYALHHGKTTVSYLRRNPIGENIFRLEQDINPKWRLRAEYFSESNIKEYALRYRIHEFLSAEYVYSTDKPYFRVVGNL